MPDSRVKPCGYDPHTEGRRVWFCLATIVVMKRLKHHPHLLPVVYLMDFRIRLTPDRSNVIAPLRQVSLSPVSGELAIVRQTQMETTLFR
jgi:hypothetical protein